MSDVMPPPEWMRDAACMGLPTDAFFPSGGALGYSGTLRWARLVCETCPVREACEEYAIEHGEVGVWGGTTTKERKREKRRRQRARTKARKANRSVGNELDTVA